MTLPVPVVLTVNSGSSSVKFALFTSEPAPRQIADGAVTGLGTTNAELLMGDGSVIAMGAGVTHASIAQPIIDWLAPHLTGGSLAGIAHRLVHGGERFRGPERIIADVTAALDDLIPLAPNHLPDAIALIKAFDTARPQTPQVACFDTAFHRNLPAVAHTVPVPLTPGLRKYGFHGLSYAYLLSELEAVAGRVAARGRVVLAHLGNGASLAAVTEGRCMDTTMGLTPTGGLVMSSRAGDLDPGIVTYLARRRQLGTDALDELLTRESGLLAISGRSADMRELLACEGTDARARLAIEIFCYQVRRWIGAFAAVLEGLDTIVFAGGVGEHAPVIRARVCDKLAFLGIELDSASNRANAAVVSTPESRVRVRVIPTNEAVMMAREAHAVLTATLHAD